MDINVITQLITTVGFPIAACIAMFYQVMKMNEQHKSELDSMKEALNNNTMALLKIYEKLGMDTN